MANQLFQFIPPLRHPLPRILHRRPIPHRHHIRQFRLRLQLLKFRQLPRRRTCLNPYHLRRKPLAQLPRRGRIKVNPILHCRQPLRRHKSAIWHLRRQHPMRQIHTPPPRIPRLPGKLPKLPNHKRHPGRINFLPQPLNQGLQRRIICPRQPHR